MKPPSMKTGRSLSLAAGTLAVATVAGCFALGVGIDPPADELYYPTAVLTSPGKHALYIVNSDFDIQYTGGTVQTVDLDSVRRCVGQLAADLGTGALEGQACANAGLDVNVKQVIYPGPCSPIKLKFDASAKGGSSPGTACELFVTGSQREQVQVPLIKESRIIGAFASSATLARSTDAGSGDASQRLFVTVRGDPSVTYFDTTDDTQDATDAFRLDCKSDGTDDLGGICPRGSRLGVSPYQSLRLIGLPVEPTGIAASDDGKAIVTVHQTGGTSTQTGGQASLLVNPALGTPTLEFVLGGLPDYPQDVAAIPTSRYVQLKNEQGQNFDYRPGFLVTFRAAREVDLLRYFDDSSGTSRHFLQRVNAFTIATNSDGSDSRGIAVSQANRRACEDKCADGDEACLEACVDVPLDVYVANRTPASLLIGKLTTTLAHSGTGQISSLTETLNINDMVPLAAGASRVAVAEVLGKDGKRSERVFALAFDSRYLVIYDPAQNRVEATLRTGRGPQAMAFDIVEKSGDDSGRAFLYVAHFTDSYVGVVDLDTRNVRTYGSMFASVGVPNPPKESQ